MRNHGVAVSEPITRRTNRLSRNKWSLAAKAAAVTAVCAASLLVGGFVLPDGRKSAPVGPEVAATSVVAPSVATPIAASARAPALAPKSIVPPPAKPELRRPASVATPVPTPQLPAGPAFYLAVAIDKELDVALADAKVPPSPLADDAEFLRRVSLDLTGTVPTYSRTIAFLKDGDSEKRARLVDELLASPEYGRLFARQWADLLIKRDFDSNKRLDTEPFVNWLSGKLNDGAGWDTIVRDILTASGKEADMPQSLFYLANQDNMQPSPAKLVGATGNLFMGVQIQCAECHVHPGVAKWSQKDFWGMAAFFAHIVADRDKGEKGRPMPGTAMIHEVEKKAPPRPMVTKKTGEKEVKPGGTIAIPDPTDNKKTVGTANAKFFEGPMPTLHGAPYRPELAKWLTSAQDKYFAANAVNRLWAHLFARGLVNPIEEMHAGNSPSHPAVLQMLSEALARNHYDQKFILRALCNTRAYQRTSRPLPENSSAEEKLLAHMPVKVIGAHELLASLTTVTSHHEPDPRQRPNQPLKENLKRPAQPLTLARYFDTREYDDDPTDFPFGVPQLLKLMNTGLTTRANELAGRIAKAAGGDRDKVIDDLYLTALTRRPKPEERERMLAFVAKQTNPQQGYAGVMWALLNSAEFVSNH